MSSHRSNLDPRHTSEYLLAILEETEKQTDVLDAILKELKRGSKAFAPLAAAKKPAKKKAK